MSSSGPPSGQSSAASTPTSRPRRRRRARGGQQQQQRQQHSNVANPFVGSAGRDHFPSVNETMEGMMFGGQGEDVPSPVEAVVSVFLGMATPVGLGEDPDDGVADDLSVAFSGDEWEREVLEVCVCVCVCSGGPLRLLQLSLLTPQLLCVLSPHKLSPFPFFCMILPEPWSLRAGCG